jgi:hypothetical protein
MKLSESLSGSTMFWDLKTNAAEYARDQLQTLAFSAAAE